MKVHAASIFGLHTCLHMCLYTASADISIERPAPDGLTDDGSVFEACSPLDANVTHFGVGLKRVPILTQCCTSIDLDSAEHYRGEQCRRKQGGTCLAGSLYVEGANETRSWDNIVARTYQEAVAFCDSFNLKVCERSCARTGCLYDGQLTWSSKTCDSAPAPPVAPPPAMVRVIRARPDDGFGNPDAPVEACVSPDATMTHFGIGGMNRPILTQCCTKIKDQASSLSYKGEQCMRKDWNPRSLTYECLAESLEDDPDFVNITHRTYSEAAAFCEWHGLAVCEQSCQGRGCHYDDNYVWSSKECVAMPPAAPPGKITIVQLADPSWMQNGLDPLKICSDADSSTKEQIINGNSETIIAQCCTKTSGECRRHTHRSADGAFGICGGGVDGHSSNPLVARTYFEAVEFCAGYDLNVCSEQLCLGTGCLYDRGFAWSSTECVDGM